MRYKHAIFFICTILFVCSCNFFQPTNVFNSKKLRGKYKVDVSPIVSITAEKARKENDFFLGLVALALTSVEIEMSFFGNNKGFIHIGGRVINLINAFGDHQIKNTEFEYQIKNDSILYMKLDLAESKEFKKWAVVRDYSDSYDHVKLIIFSEEKEAAIFDLERIKEYK